MSKYRINVLMIGYGRARWQISLFRVENFFLLDPPYRKWEKNKTETCILRVIEFSLMEQESCSKWRGTWDEWSDKTRRGLLKRALTGKSGIRRGSIPSWSGLSDITIVSRDIGAIAVLCREGVDGMGHVHVRIADWDIHGCLGLRAPVRGGRTESWIFCSSSSSGSNGLLVALL